MHHQQILPFIKPDALDKLFVELQIFIFGSSIFDRRVDDPETILAGCVMDGAQKRYACDCECDRATGESLKFFFGHGGGWGIQSEHAYT